MSHSKKLHNKKLYKKIHTRSQVNSGVPLVLLPGWGFDSRIWQDLLEPLQLFSQIITLDLPGFSDNRSITWYGQEEICHQIVQTMPPQAFYAGWSLGGMLATKIAATFPNRVMGIITLATNISFIQRDRWPHAMDAINFQNFYRAVDNAPEQTLKRFHLLISQGDELSRQQFKWLQAMGAQAADYKQLLPALSLLKEIDNSEDICKLQVPGLHIFGEQDHLVPASAVKRLVDLFVQNNYYQQQCHLLKNTGHLVFWPGNRVIPLIKSFVTRVSATIPITPPNAVQCNGH